jgi:outer membrane protein assembly factor BamB
MHLKSGFVSRQFPGLLTLLGLFGFAASGQEWTRFRGPNGSGIGQAKTLPSKLTESDLAWKATLRGSGHSSPVLWGQRVFVTCTGDKAGGISVVCLNANDGKQIWSRDFALTAFAKHALNSFAASTPTIDSERLYVVWNEPDHHFLTALDHNGKTVWQRDFGPFISQHACGTSPILCDDKIVLANFQDNPAFIEGPHPDSRTGKSSIIAVSAKTGQTIWETPRSSTVVGYSTPCVFEPKEGQRALIFNSQSHGVSALDPVTGKVLWESAKVFDKRTVSSPVIAGELILGSCGSGGGGNSVTAVKATGAGKDLKPEIAYQIKKSAPYVPTSIALGDLIWLWSDAGIVTCISAATGDIRYQERVGGNYFSSPVAADGRIFCISKTGEIVVLEASDKFNVLGRYTLNDTCESTPAIALGKLFIHTEKQLWCLGHPTPIVTP